LDRKLEGRPHEFCVLLRWSDRSDSLNSQTSMMFSLRVVVAVAAALLVSIPAATAFVPSSAVSSSRTLVSSFELNALNRRDAVGVALAGLFSLDVLPADATNPALETF
jgi:hypothetical protein